MRAGCSTTGPRATTLTVNGTNADNAIDYNPGSAIGGGLVSIDGFETIEFENKANLVINALGGDDVVTYNGTAATDAIIITPTSVNSAMIIDGVRPNVDVLATESVTINGLGGDDGLTVTTPAGADTITYTPGATVDSAAVRVGSMVLLSITNLGAAGTVSLADAGTTRTDHLVHEGTAADDVFDVAATSGDITLNSQLVVSTTGIDSLTLRGLNGDDLMMVHSPQPYSIVLLQGGDPGGSDLVQILAQAGVNDAVEVIPSEPDGNGTVMINGLPIVYSGLENLHLLGDPGDNDSLLINGTLAENQWEVERGSLPHGTRVQIDSRELIEYGEFVDIELRNAKASIGGADVFRVHPAYIGNLTVTGHGEDVLQIIGAGGDDVTALTITQATLSATPLSITAVTYSGIIQLDVLTGSGDDILTIDVTGSDLIGTPITFDGGEGSDSLTFSGRPLSGSAEATYRPGPAEGQGRLVHDDGITTMTIDFLNLEPVVDLVPGPLTVMGTPAFNTINYEQGITPNLGRVTVDNFELIEFSLKTSLTIDAMAGNDVINLDNAAQPTGLAGITVLGRDGDDVMIAGSGDNAYDGGAGFDTIGILGTLGNDRVDIDQTSGNTLFSEVNGDTRNDTFTEVETVRVELNRGDDIIRVAHDDSLVATPGDSLRMEVLGDAPNASDRLAVLDDGLGDVVIYRKAQDGRSGSITVGPLAPVVFQVYFEEIGTLANGRAGLPGDGNLDIEVYDVDGTLIAGYGPDFGGNDADSNERIRIPAVAGQTYFLRVFGSSSDAVNVYGMTVVNEVTPVPYDIELDDIPVGDPPPQNSDTGRSQFDDITRDNTPVIVFRLDDARLLHDLPGNPADDTPPDEVIPIAFNPSQTETTTTAGYRVAVFDEGDPQQPGQLPQVPVGYARQVAEGVYEFNFDTDSLDPGFNLTDGSHFISAKVQMIDPADPTQTGFGERSVSLEIVVDTIVPPVSFGEDGVANDGLHPDSDSGIEDQPGTFVDRITSDTTPSFWGIAEADAVVRVYADLDGDFVLSGGDLFLGAAVAVPLDGTNQFPRGEWNFTTNIDMNDPAYFTSIDGLRAIFVTAEDVAGNVSEPELLNIFIDTRGPRVDSVSIVDHVDYDLFDPKPSEDGPTPLVYSLDIDFIDEPVRVGEVLIVGDDAVFVIDVSGSTSSSFVGTPVGDVNGDGSADTILDAEIAGFIALNQALIDRGLGNISNVSIVAFASGASQLDMDPITAGTQLATTPSADMDGNGTPDVEDVLRSLTDGGSTNFEAALQDAINTIGAVGTAPADGNVIFLSDGDPTAGGTYDDEVATLQGMGHNLRAFGVGSSSSLPALQIIDPSAIQFTTTDELLDVFGGGGSSGGSSVFIYPALNEILATMPGNIQLVGDANGIIPIESIEFIDETVVGDIGRTTIRLHFFDPLPDDRFTLTVSDRIKDDAGNALDGETNTAEPQENPRLPSGDGDPGEDFIVRFIIDSRPEIGVWAAGSVWVDTNGNFVFDPTNTDFTNRDITYTLAFTSDDVFAGNFAGPGPDGIFGTSDDTTAPAGDAVADGFDKLAAYGRAGSQYRWLIDTDNGDEVGLFTGSTWWLDTNHDFKVDTPVASAIVGYPIVGDFDGDGRDDLAAWADDRFSFDLAHNGFGQKDAVIDEGFAVVAGFIGVRERPVAADMDQDGIDDIGLWVPDRAGATPEEAAEWYFLISDDHGGQQRATGTVTTLDHPFTPIPFGEDMYAKFGDDHALPVVGNFDPPVTGGEADPSVTNTPRLSMTLVRTATAIGANGEVATLGDSEAWIGEWDTHWVEIWASTPDADTSSVVGASFNLSYNSEYFTATDIEFGPAFTESQTGGINDAAGIVEAIGATTTLDDVGDDGYVLLARVLFESLPGDSGVMLGISQEYITQVDNLGLGLSDGYVELSDSGLVAATLGYAPDTTLMPVIYDLDDDGRIGLGDLAFFASVYREQPGITTESPYAYAADFDRSGTVDLGDLAFFAANLGLGRPNSSLVYPAEVSQSSLPAPETSLTTATASAILPGDANLDGVVDNTDAITLALNWQKQTAAIWAEGDFNADGRIDALDQAILAQHWMMTIEDMEEDDAHERVFAAIGEEGDALGLFDE